MCASAADGVFMPELLRYSTMIHFLLVLSLAQASAADTVLAAARRSVDKLADTAAVRSAGFVPIEEIPILDRTPFQGQHWFEESRSDTLPDVSLGRPAFVMFSPVNGVIKRVGIAYSARLLPGTTTPGGLAGDRSAAWHEHFICQDIPGRPGPAVVANDAACRTRGGTPAPRRTVMVHVWTDVPNPEGVYGHDNPALPFLAVGIRPPDPHDLHDPARVRTIRMLALALGETYDARMQTARVVETRNRDAALADSLRAHRAAISALIPALREAEASRNKARYDQITTKMIGEWDALRLLYERMAPTDALRNAVRQQHEEAMTISKHH
jgi:hypothetical protein